MWQILDKHYEEFERSYEEKFENQYGFYRLVIGEVVRSYLKCEDLKEGFARVRCPNCAHEFLLQFSCSGFRLDNGVRIERGDKKGREAIAQYIMRNVFRTEKINYTEKAGKVVYRSHMQQGRNRKNFVVYSVEEFIAAITQHIPKKNFQMIRYYGWYSNKSRGLRAKAEIVAGNINSDENTLAERILEQRELAHGLIH